MSGLDDAALLRAKARLGTVLRGKYRLDRVLGVGGMAVVYAATHRNNAQFAIKMLHPELSLRSDLRERFIREGYIANTVKHPGAVLISDDDVAEDGAAFIVMEMLRGAPVDSLCGLYGGRLPLAAAVAIIDQLLDVVAAAHANGIIHRDIKPANIFVTYDGTVKVLDFGIARLRDSTSADKTSTGMVMGTPAFMAPEQAVGLPSEIAPQTDIWAVGATLFSLLSGTNVHIGETSQQLFVAAATAQPRPILSVVPDLAVDVARVIDCALSFHRHERWPSAAAMQQALRAACAANYGVVNEKAVLAELLRPMAPSGTPTVVASAASSGDGFAVPHSTPPAVTGRGSSSGPIAPQSYCAASAPTQPLLADAVPPETSGAGGNYSVTRRKLSLAAILATGAVAITAVGARLVHHPPAISAPIPATARIVGEEARPASLVETPVASEDLPPPSSTDGKSAPKLTGAAPVNPANHDRTKTVSMTEKDQIARVTDSLATRDTSPLPSASATIAVSGDHDRDHQAQEHGEAARMKANARDGAGCLAELDAHDGFDARPTFLSTNASSIYGMLRGQCLMLTGHCDQGKALYRQFMQKNTNSGQMGPAQLEMAVDTFASMNCQGGMGPRDQLLKALLDLQNGGFSQKKTVAECRAAFETVRRTLPVVQPRDEDDTLVTQGKARLRASVGMCFAKAGDCDAAFSTFREALRLDTSVKFPATDEAVRVLFEANVSKCKK